MGATAEINPPRGTIDLLKRTLAVLALVAAVGIAHAEGGPGDPASVENQDGKYYDANGDPTYHIGTDGTVDFDTYSGFRRYHAECHVCHGPDGLGSTYAPALVDSLKRLDYTAFSNVVVNGRQNVHGGTENVMPAFGTNPNVMCYMDDIYIYLRARSQGDLPRGRPAKKEAKSEGFKEAEDACMGSG